MCLSIEDRVDMFRAGDMAQRAILEEELAYFRKYHERSESEYIIMIEAALSEADKAKEEAGAPAQAETAEAQAEYVEADAETADQHGPTYDPSRA